MAKKTVKVQSKTTVTRSPVKATMKPNSGLVSGKIVAAVTKNK